MIVRPIDSGDVVVSGEAVERIKLAIASKTSLSPEVVSRIVDPIWVEAVKIADANYVLSPDRAPKSLPADRPKYRDRQDRPDLKHLDAIKFMQTVYPEFGKIYQFLLEPVDPSLLKAVRNQCAAQGLNIGDYMKTRHDYARERLGLDDVTEEQIVELKREMRAISNGLTQLKAEITR